MNDENHYEYKFKDHSLLLRVLERPVFGPIVRALPTVITPNQVTLAGHVVVWAACAAVLAVPVANAWVLISLALAYAIYVVSDCIDGMFARHTQRTSRLGELLDHGLDAFSLPLVPLCFGIALQQPAWVTLSATTAVTFMNFATLMHGFRVGYVHLGAVGIIEGVLAGAAACLIAAIIGIGPLAHPVLAGISIGGWLLLSLVGGGLTALVSMRGLARRPLDFVTIATLLVATIAWCTWGKLPVSVTGLLLTALGSYHSCKVTCARLLRRPLVLWDAGLLVLMGVALGGSLGFQLSAVGQATAASCVIVYAVVRTSVLFFGAVNRLRATGPTAALAMQS